VALKHRPLQRSTVAGAIMAAMKTMAASQDAQASA
jgi:hypothetical protein